MFLLDTKAKFFNPLFFNPPSLIIVIAGFEHRLRLTSCLKSMADLMWKNSSVDNES